LQPVHQDAHTFSTTGLPANCARLTCPPVIGSWPCSAGASPLASPTAAESAEGAAVEAVPFRLCAIANPPTIATTTATVAAT
jgi:hypothetical protein